MAQVPWKQMQPKCRSDWFGCVFSIFGINAIYWYELLTVLPWVSTQSDSYSTLLYYTHAVSATFLYVNAMWSFWKVISTDTSTVGVMLPVTLKPDWRFCVICESNSPPRSYHCHLCKRCLLRRDHHCVFTGNCIGIHNHRYYMLLIGNACAASVYAVWMNIDFMWTALDGEFYSSIFSTGILKLIFPFLSWLLGYITFGGMLRAGMMVFCLASGCVFSALLGYHLRNMYFGQLTHERTHRVFKYSIGWKDNIQQVFGEKWRLAWITPFFESKLSCDGLEFPLASKYENPKDL